MFPKFCCIKIVTPPLIVLILVVNVLLWLILLLIFTLCLNVVNRGSPETPGGYSCVSVGWVGCAKSFLCQTQILIVVVFVF